MTKTIIAILIIVAAGAVIVFWPKISLSPIFTPSPTGVACTKEAKLCPDGSAVGREGPNCEFAACPAKINTTIIGTTTSAVETTIKGTVTISPICPVERIPPDPKCAPKPIATEITAVSVPEKTLTKTVQSQSDGRFQISLPAGNYLIQATSGKPYPRCSPVNITIPGPNLNNVNLTCDTGIR